MNNKMDSVPGRFGKTILLNSSEEYPLGFKSVLGSMLIVQTVCGILFNIAVFAAGRFSRKNKKDCPIGNALNVSLCVVDLLICATGMPLTIRLVTGPRKQESLICLLQEGTVSFASSATAVNLLIISLDRFDAVTRPFSRRITSQNVVCILVIAWLVAFIGFLSPFIAFLITSLTGVSPYHIGLYMLTKYPCFFWVETSAKIRIYFGIFYLLLYLVANTTMIISYFRIYRVARHRVNVRLALVRASLPGLADDQLEEEQRKKDQNRALKSSEKTVTRTSLMIVATFIVCWAPHTVVNVVMMVTESTLTMEMVQLSCLTLAFFSSVLHPMLYVFIRKPFREALCNKFRRNKVSTATDNAKVATTK